MTCPVCGYEGEHVNCWIGRARMAQARHAAGLPLDDVDRAALARFPGDPLP